MLTLRPCHPRPYRFLSYNPLKTFTFPHFSFSPQTKPLSLPFNPHPKMSSRASAFDLLMSGARAAAAKKNPQSTTSSSPKRRKTLDAQNPKTSISSVTHQVQQNAEKPILHLQKSVEPQDSVDTKPAQEPVKNGERPEKKSKVVSVNERVAELKSKLVLLKNKPGDFDPKAVACWEKGERVPFIFLSLVFDLISKETGRIVITDIVCNMLRTVMDTTPEDLVAVVYLAANKIAPAHEGLELGIGDASIIKALAEAYGRTEAQVKKQYKVLYVE